MDLDEGRAIHGAGPAIRDEGPAIHDEGPAVHEASCSIGDQGCSTGDEGSVDLDEGCAVPVEDRHWPGRLDALARKYRVLAELAAAREARATSNTGRFPPAEGAARREAMAGVARRFPGALRELDRLPSTTLAARAAAAEACAARLRVDAAAPVPVELALAALYHRELRRALVARRWLVARGATAPSPAVSAAFARRFRIPAGEAQVAIVRALRPPGGRLGAAVLVALAARFGLDPADAAARLFGPPPRR